MKFILFLLCGVAFLQNFTFGRLQLNEDAIVGVKQVKLEEYLTKAFNGFKKIMSKGDEELDYPVMEPYKVAPFSWEYVDKSGSKKLNLISTGETVIKGLSNFNVRYITADAKDMKVIFNLRFSNLEAQFPYKLDGYLYKSLIPIFGEGLIKLFSEYELFQFVVNLGTEKGYIVVEDVYVFRYKNEVKVKATGLMDLPDKFINSVLDDTLGSLAKQYADKMLTQLARGVIEETVSGMTTDEFFDLLDHFVKINNENGN